MLVATGLCALAIALVHHQAWRLRFLDAIPRSRWLSFAGGVSVAYVFLHVLPELADLQAQVVHGRTIVARVENHAYLVALVGLATFYGIERWARDRRADPDLLHHADPFWPHISAFAGYNVVIGYLLLRRPEEGLPALVSYAFAVGLHFLVIDHGLRQHHPRRYRQVGRWVLAVSILVGWIVSALVGLPPAVVSVLFAFVAGALVLNVLKEELPENRHSRFLPFLLGAGSFSALLVTG